MHVDNSYPLYCLEAHQRMSYYPAPYWTGSYWGYVTPWLWYDGDKHGSYTYSTWQSKIVNRMNQASPVTITMGGEYSPTDGSGTIYAQFRNDSTATINGRVIFVITEDSLYYAAPNGDNWHNHVARDYLPNQNGQTVSIPAGNSVTVSQPFTIQSGWNVDKCEIVTWIQNDVMQPDTTKEIWQAGMIKVTNIGIKETNHREISTRAVNPIPNPCVEGTRFVFSLPEGVEYRINLFDVTGRRIRTLKGTATGNTESVKWQLRDDKGSLVGSGVYLYRFESDRINTTGKVVVR